MADPQPHRRAEGRRLTTCEALRVELEGDAHEHNPSWIQELGGEGRGERARPRATIAGGRRPRLAGGLRTADAGGRQPLAALAGGRRARLPEGVGCGHGGAAVGKESSERRSGRPALPPCARPSPRAMAGAPAPRGHSSRATAGTPSPRSGLVGAVHGGQAGVPPSRTSVGEESRERRSRRRAPGASAWDSWSWA
ncbi:hypothetical protein BS78_05G164900 [Paspalum vaginatum]|nr:hypothetical protein BS78_05G164900 [Paspalum vaginatum]